MVIMKGRPTAEAAGASVQEVGLLLPLEGLNDIQVGEPKQGHLGPRCGKSWIPRLRYGSESRRKKEVPWPLSLVVLGLP